MTEYATIAEVRDYTGVVENEFSDATITNFIGTATNRIDDATRRTWQGEQTVTDAYYTGNGTARLSLDNADITSIDALSINVSPTGTTYTTVTTSNVRYRAPLGLIELQPNAEVNYFPEYFNSTKISFKHGNSTIPDDIKQAALYLIAYMMKIDSELHDDYRNIINQYKVESYNTV